MLSDAGVLSALRRIVQRRLLAIRWGPGRISHCIGATEGARTGLQKENSPENGQSERGLRQ